MENGMGSVVGSGLLLVLLARGVLSDQIRRTHEGHEIGTLLSAWRTHDYPSPP